MQIDAELLASGFRGLLCQYLNGEHLFESRLVAADVTVGAPRLTTGIMAAMGSRSAGSVIAKTRSFATSVSGSASGSACGASRTPGRSTLPPTTSPQSARSANLLLLIAFGVLLLVATRVSSVESAPTMVGPWFAQSGYGNYAGSYGHGGYGALQRGQFAHGGLGAAWECGVEHMQVRSAHDVTRGMELSSMGGGTTTGTGTSFDAMPNVHATTSADHGTQSHQSQSLSRQHAKTEQESCNKLD